MPTMPRAKGKATKIAWDIIGKPLSMNVKKTPRQQEVNKRLVFEETTRVR